MSIASTASGLPRRSSQVLISGPHVNRQYNSLGHLRDGNYLGALATRPTKNVVERRRNDLPRALAETAHLVC